MIKFELKVYVDSALEETITLTVNDSSIERITFDPAVLTTTKSGLIRMELHVQNGGSSTVYAVPSTETYAFAGGGVVINDLSFQNDAAAFGIFDELNQVSLQELSKERKQIKELLERL